MKSTFSIACAAFAWFTSASAFAYETNLTLQTTRDYEISAPSQLKKLGIEKIKVRDRLIEVTPLYYSSRKNKSAEVLWNWLVQDPAYRGFRNQPQIKANSFFEETGHVLRATAGGVGVAAGGVVTLIYGTCFVGGIITGQLEFLPVCGTTGAGALAIFAASWYTIADPNLKKDLVFVVSRSKDSVERLIFKGITQKDSDTLRKKIMTDGLLLSLSEIAQTSTKDLQKARLMTHSLVDQIRNTRGVRHSRQLTEKLNKALVRPLNSTQFQIEIGAIERLILDSRR